MSREPAPQSVEITLSTGRVLHYKTTFGDVITLNKVITQPTGTPGTSKKAYEYYTVTIVPKPRAEGREDAV